MKKIYSLLVAFAVASGASFASGPDLENTKKKVTPKSSQKSEVFEPMFKEDPDEVQHLSMDPEEKISSDSEDEEEKSSSLKITQTPPTPFGDSISLEEAVTADEMYANHDAERAASSMLPRRTPLMQFAHNVRTALPHLIFTAAMTGLTANELNDRDGPDASIIPLSSMALLGGLHAVQVMRSGQNSTYSMIPNTLRDVIRTGVSVLPGLAYSTYHYFTNYQPSTISEATKKCVKSCLEQE